MKLTWRSLHEAAKDLYLREGTSHRFRSLAHTNSVAGVEYRGKSDVEIESDPVFVSHLQAILHECAHVLCDRYFSAFSDRVAEAFILVLEERLFEYAKDKRDRRRWWRDAISEKAALTE